jgi:hypothetical protein
MTIHFHLTPLATSGPDRRSSPTWRQVDRPGGPALPGRTAEPGCLCSRSSTQASITTYGQRMKKTLGLKNPAGSFRCCFLPASQVLHNPA